MKLNIISSFLVLALFLSSCGNQSNKTKKEDSSCCNTEQQKGASCCEEEQTVSVDKCLAEADQLVGKKIQIEAVCTHICAHGGGKIFLMGTDDTKVIRVQASEKLGRFDDNCVNSLVQVHGTLMEERIDEAYLQEWEKMLKDQTAEKHGNGGEGCESSKKARQEAPSNSPEERISNFRKQIAERKAKEGKEYLSFYFVVCDKYDIK